jgi:hypothetical protein
MLLLLLRLLLFVAVAAYVVSIAKTSTTVVVNMATSVFAVILDIAPFGAIFVAVKNLY